MFNTKLIKHLQSKHKQEIILALLHRRVIPLAEFPQILNLSQANVTYHMKGLSSLGLIKRETFKNYIDISLDRRVFKRLVVELQDFLQTLILLTEE